MNQMHINACLQHNSKVCLHTKLYNLFMLFAKHNLTACLHIKHFIENLKFVSDQSFLEEPSFVILFVR